VQQGIKVAICEQLTEPGRGLVERGVVRIVTPGTLVEDALLDAGRNNYLAAINPIAEGYGLAYVDVTTGEFALTEFTGALVVERLETELLRLAPAECLAPDTDPPGGGGASVVSPGKLTLYDDYRFDPDTARDVLCRQFGVSSLEGFGCVDLPRAVGAAGAIVSYLDRTNRSLLGLLTGLRTYQTTSYMTLDRYTRRSLELTESARSGGVRGSLLWVLDRTQTPMGGRLLRRFLGQPLLDPDLLDMRLDAVAELNDLPIVGAQLRTVLTRISDVERLSGRARQGLASPRDLLGLLASLRHLGELQALLRNVTSAELARVREEIDTCDDVAGLIEQAVVEVGSERLIKPGYDAELDELVGSIKSSREWIAQLEGTERARTGIRSLKVGYNKVFGYYIEVSNANTALVPPAYIRKQTLINAERYITPGLKECEARILQAEDRIGAMERRLFTELQARIGHEHHRLAATADALAHLDLYRALAEVAGAHNYVRPELDVSDRLEIIAGRHPVVEVSLEGDGFIPNNCDLDCSERQIVLLTGPNMGGKSTYLRQVALTALMAQIGSFVPAERARIGLVDRIFSRVGAQDDIAAGQSTFMVEMVETANIMHHATAKSLLVLDEIGRGTSTYDGLAIARAVVEHVHDRIGARTLFATHYHELTALADRFTRIHNANVAVAEDGHDVVFLHRVVPGGADRSYGIHVARLAGLPSSVTERAREALLELESKAQQNGSARRRQRMQQMPLFGEVTDGLAAQLLDEILALDVSTLTPLEAITRLYELQRKGKGG
jgi:DNA mismatch repair protein MutS